MLRSVIHSVYQNKKTIAVVVVVAITTHTGVACAHLCPSVLVCVAIGNPPTPLSLRYPFEL